MSNICKSIFISYSHKDKKEANYIDHYFLEKGVMLERDIRGVDYSESFIDFMKKIRSTDYVIMLISRNYLLSVNCMYELMQVMKDEDYQKRLHPIIVSGDLVYRIEGHLEIIEYWTSKYNELKSRVSNIDITAVEHLVNELKKMEAIKSNIGEFLNFLQEMKYTSYEEHVSLGFKYIFKSIGFPLDTEHHDSDNIDYVTKSYTIWKHDDISHGLAKRYSAIIMLNENMNKEQIRKLTEDITEEIKLSTYYRSKIVKDSFGDKPADVVWLYFARDIQDVNMFNWICRTQWISPKLDELGRPMNLGGDEIYRGIELKWNDRYVSSKQFYEKNSGTKEEILNAIDDILPIMIKYAEKMEHIFAKYSRDRGFYDEICMYSENSKSHVTDLYLKYNNLPIPPVELEEYTRACDQLMATIDNMFLFYSKTGLDTWKEGNRSWLLNNALKTFKKDRKRFEVEQDKLGT